MRADTSLDLEHSTHDYFTIIYLLWLIKKGINCQAIKKYSISSKMETIISASFEASDSFVVVD